MGVAAREAIYLTRVGAGGVGGVFWGWLWCYESHRLEPLLPLLLLPRLGLGPRGGVGQLGLARAHVRQPTQRVVEQKDRLLY
jgi:hypothetical protein